jgi:hypothetical protein
LVVVDNDGSGTWVIAGVSADSKPLVVTGVSHMQYKALASAQLEHMVLPQLVEHQVRQSCEEPVVSRHWLPTFIHTEVCEPGVGETLMADDSKPLVTFGVSHMQYKALASAQLEHAPPQLLVHQVRQS